MRGFAFSAALLLISGCGQMPELPTTPISSDGGTTTDPPPTDPGPTDPPPTDPPADPPPTDPVDPPPTNPPATTHNEENDVVVPLNEARQIKVGGVEFTVLRTAEATGTIIARNLNSDSVHVIVDRVNGGGGVALTKTFLGHNETESNDTLDLEPGINLRFSVKVWKSGLDFLTCGFASDTCYRSSEKKTFVIWDQ